MNKEQLVKFIHKLARERECGGFTYGPLVMALCDAVDDGVITKAEELIPLYEAYLGGFTDRHPMSVKAQISKLRHAINQGCRDSI